MSAETPLTLAQLYDNNGVSLYIPEPTSTANLHCGQHSLRRLKLGGLNDLYLVDDSDIVNATHKGQKKYRRLDNFIRLVWGPNNTSVYIVDHHQFALYCWAEAIKEGRIKPEASLRHYDDHDDGGVVSMDFMTRQVFQERRWNLREFVEFVKVIGCWQFIEPAQRIGLIDEFIHIEPGNDPKIYVDSHTPPKILQASMRFYRDHSWDLAPVSKIVDIDLDYFASKYFNPEDQDLDIQTMRNDIVSAGVATFATSPGFIDPKRAVELIKKILG